MNSRFNLSVLIGIGLLFVLGGTFIAIDDEYPPNQRDHYLALFPSAANSAHQSSLRIINHSPTDGEAHIVAYDDDGNPFGPLSLSIEANSTIHLNSSDLEHGNSDLGLEGSTGSGQGDWHLVISSDLDLDVLSYIQSADGYLTTSHNIVPNEDHKHHVTIFEPGSSQGLHSQLHLTNPSNEEATVTISGVDDLGHQAGPGVTIRIPPHASRTYTSNELESGSRDYVSGYLGDGVGRWRLTLESSVDILALNLLESSSGHLTNLSTPPIRQSDGHYSVPLIPRVSNETRQQGFLRIVNLSTVAGSIEIQPYDDSDHVYDPLYLSIEANEAKHVSSEDLEFGNTDIGLIGSAGAGEGNWRLDLKSDLRIQVSSYMRDSVGFYTRIHDTVSRFGHEYQVAFFDRFNDTEGSTFLRFVNRSDELATVVIRGVDDEGSKSSGLVRFEIPSLSATEITSDELLGGSDRFHGNLGIESGSWRLLIKSSTAIEVMNLFVDSEGRVSNLSVAPDSHFAPIHEVAFRDRLGKGWTFTDATGNTSFFSDGRFYSNAASETRGGNYEYTRVGRNQSRIDLTFDDGEQCVVQLHYSSSTAFAQRRSCGADINTAFAVVQYSRTPIPSSAEKPSPFQLDGENTDAVGVTYASGRLYVPDADGHVYVYTAAGDREEDAEFDLDTENDNPLGIAHVDGALYVVDGTDLKIYAYSASGERSSSADIDLDDDNDRPQGVTYANGRLHVVDNFLDVFAYQLTGERDTNREFELDRANLFPRGITFANDRFYVVDWFEKIVLAYTESGARAEAFDFVMDSDASFSSGITHDGQWFYVVDHIRNRIWTYTGEERPPDGPDLTVTLTDSTALTVAPAEAFDLSVRVVNEGNEASPESVLRYYESDDYIVTRYDAEFTSDDIPALEPAQSQEFSTEVTAPDAPGTYYYGACSEVVENETDEYNNCSYGLEVTVSGDATPTDQEGLIANVTRLEYELDNHSYDGLAYAEGDLFALVGGFSFDVHGFDTSGQRNAEADFRLNTDNAGPERIAYANEKLYVIDEEDERVYAYDLDGNRQSSSDFELDPSHIDLDGLTFAEGMFFVVDELYSPDRIFVYSATGERVPTADFDLDEDNGGAVGIAHANGRLFVVDHFEQKVFAYTISGERLPAFDFALDEAHSSPQAMTYGEGSFYVVGEDAIFVYSFDEGSGISAADLATTITQTERRVGTNSSIDLHAKVRNRGDLPAVASTLRYYRSTDNVIDSSDTEIGSVEVPALDVSSSSEHTFEITETSEVGTYYYGACVDLVENESRTVNNCSASMRVVVAATGGPDLAVMGMLPPQQIWTRQAFTMAALVNNLGDAETDETTLRFYLSADAEIDDDDLEVARFDLQPLVPGASRSYSTSLFSPGDPGTHYYGVCADALSTESDQTNNCSLAFEISTTMQVCSFALNDDNRRPAGVAYANGTLLVPDSGFDRTVFAYSTDGSRQPDSEFGLSSQNRGPYRATFGDDALYVLDSRADAVFAYTATGERISSGEFDLETDDNEGISYADGHLFLLEEDLGSVLAYTLAGERVETADFDLDPYNSDPTGIAFGDSRFYVLDGNDGKAYAYETSGTRFEEEDFDLHAANVDPAGITFDGQQFHVVDGSSNRLYTYPHRSDAASAQPCFREGVLAHRFMFENTPPRVNVGEPVRVNGSDSARYTLSGEDASQFEIVPETGQIRTREGIAYDHETTDQYELEVAVSYDDSDALDTIAVTVDVLDEYSSCSINTELNPRAVGGDGYLTLSWSAPSIDDFEGVARILGFETQIKERSTFEWTDHQTFYSSSVNSVIYANLENDVEYDLRVRTINAESECSWFLPISGTPTADLAPKDIQEHHDRFGPYPVGSPDRNFRVVSPGRCRHTLDGSSLDANCTYERKGPASADILLEFDDPTRGSCGVSLAYSSLTAGSFIDECFDAGVNTEVDFDRGFRMPSVSSGEPPSGPVARAPRTPEEFAVFVWGSDDLIPGLGFGCPPAYSICDFSPGFGYLISDDPVNRLRTYSLGKYSYKNTGPTSGTLTFHANKGTQYKIELEFTDSGHVHATIDETSATNDGWPGMPHLDLSLGAPTVLLPIPPSWEAAIAVETDFSNIDENVVRRQLLQEFFPDFGALIAGATGLNYQQDYMLLGRNRAVQTFEFPSRPDWVFDGLPEEERARKLFLNGSKWVVTLDFNSDGSAFVSLQFVKEGAYATMIEGFIDFLGEDASLETFPPELQFPDEAPQASGEDISDVEVAMAVTVSEIDDYSLQTILVSAAGFDFNPGDWLEPKDGGNQRMMIVGSGQSAAARISMGHVHSGPKLKLRDDLVQRSVLSDPLTIPRRAASVSPYSQISSDLVKLTVVCMQFDRDVPMRGSRFFSKPKVAEGAVQTCQKECVLAGGDEIQGCVWRCE